MDLLKQIKSNEDIADLLPTTVSRRSKNQNLKPLVLICGHLLDDDRVRDPRLQESLKQILKNGNNHIKMMLEVGQEINAMARIG